MSNMQKLSNRRMQMPVQQQVQFCVAEESESSESDTDVKSAGIQPQDEQFYNNLSDEEISENELDNLVDTEQSEEQK